MQLYSGELDLFQFKYQSWVVTKTLCPTQEMIKNLIPSTFFPFYIEKLNSKKLTDKRSHEKC